jgi:CheY-like chemotaxis protein
MSMASALLFVPVLMAARSVLLVDDNAGLRSGLATVLEDEGIRTLQAERGEDAIKLIQQVRFDLLVLDLNLPDMTGVRVYSSIRQHAKACIFMTAEASEELIEQAMKLDPLRLLRKPFEVKLFRELVRSAVAN